MVGGGQPVPIFSQLESGDGIIVRINDPPFQKKKRTGTKYHPIGDDLELN